MLEDILKQVEKGLLTAEEAKKRLATFENLALPK